MSAWIPMRTDLGDDPAIITIAAATGLDEFGVVGRLHKLWSWSNTHLASGNAAGVSELWLDRYVAATGFSKAMVVAGWLRVTAEGVEFPKFDRWNSQCAKRRALTARRVAEHKSRANASINAGSVSGALPKEQNRRLQEKDTPQPPAERGGGGVSNSNPRTKPKKPRELKPGPESVPIPPAIDTAEFRAAWANWLADRADRRNPVTARAAGQQLAKLAALGPVAATASINTSIERGWTGLFPPDSGSETPATPPKPPRPTDTAADVAAAGLM